MLYKYPFQLVINKVQVEALIMGALSTTIPHLTHTVKLSNDSFGSPIMLWTQQRKDHDDITWL